MRPIKFRVWDKRFKTMENLIKLEQLNDETYDVMQFTGLLDKNGKEIYEGDVLNVIEWNNGDPRKIEGVEVGWCESSACFFLYPKTNIGNDLGLFDEEDEYEIVGTTL